MENSILVPFLGLDLSIPPQKQLVNYMRKLFLAHQEIQFKLFHEAKGINTTAFSYHLQIRHNYVILRFEVNLG